MTDAKSTATGDGRDVDLALARLHLRLGALSIARAELETLAGAGRLDDEGLTDLAEARWRTSDLVGAGQAAQAALDAGREDLVALIVAAEATAALGRPSEARRLAGRALETARVPMDRMFAGMPRASIWPADPSDVPHDVSAPAKSVATSTSDAVTGGGAGSGPAGATSGAPGADGAPAISAVATGELDRGRAAIDAGDARTGALRLALALRLAPSTAAAILEAIPARPTAELDLLRGDALRALGREVEAQQAYDRVASANVAPSKGGTTPKGGTTASKGGTTSAKAPSEEDA
jgi:tetratricopeptide (TPR) repeat protein